jgi:HTH-type transcriptional regulator / antitoxin HipB
MFPFGNMNTRTPHDLGAVIRQRRKHLKVTQKDLAMTCGTGLRFIIELEQGKTTCQIGKVLSVVHALGLQLELKAPATPTGRGGDS